jgi:DNA-binding transcriptional LysR family regulator
MPEPLNLVHLRSLVAVVDRRSFTRAARVLHLSQSTVSQHIMLLERRVGGELLVREPAGVRLTPLGGEFVDRARILLAEHDELLGDFDAASGPGAGRRSPRRRLAIGSAEHAADQVLPRLLAAFRATFPGHELTFALQRSTVLIDAVRRGDLDIAATLAITPDAPGTRVGELSLRWMADEALDLTVAPGSGRILPLVALEEPCAPRSESHCCPSRPACPPGYAS